MGGSVNDAAHDIVREAFQAGYRFGASSRDHEIGVVSAAADHWYYAANNPAEARKAHAEILAGFDRTQHRAATAEEHELLDRLEVDDPLEYRRLRHLAMSSAKDYAVAIAALDGGKP
jgi:hypothetical protein